MTLSHKFSINPDGRKAMHEKNVDKLILVERTAGSVHRVTFQKRVHNATLSQYCITLPWAMQKMQFFTMMHI